MLEPYTIEEVGPDETHYVPVEEENHTFGNLCACEPTVKVGPLGIYFIHNEVSHA